MSEGHSDEQLSGREGSEARTQVTTGLTALRESATGWAGSAEGVFSALSAMLADMARHGATSYAFGVNAGAGFESPTMPPAELSDTVEYQAPGGIQSYSGLDRVDAPADVGDPPDTSINFQDIGTVGFNVGNSPQDMANVHAPSFPNESDFDLADISFSPSSISSPRNYTPPNSINPDSYTVGDPTHGLPDSFYPGDYKFQRPNAVTYSGDVANGRQPFVPNLSGVQQLVWTWQDSLRNNRPAWELTPHNSTLPSVPDDLDVQAPGDAPALENITLSSYSGPTDPIKPLLDTLTTTQIRDVTLPSFTIPFNSAELPTLSVGLNYSDPGYIDAQVSELKTQISRVLNGDLGIPASIWDAMWDKARSQITRQGVARERQARQAWAKLGWSMPGGVALAQVEQAWQDINEQTSEKSREMAIQRATMMREDFWNAVQHGVACQKMLTDLYNAQEERKLKAAIALVEALVNVYNANVSKYNADLQRVQAMVAVKELELKGALATIEVDKAKLEGDKLRADINKLKVDIYVSEWEGVKAAVSKYASMVEADKIKLDAQRLKIEAYGEEVKAYATQVDAWAKQWTGYTAQVDGQKLLASTYEANINAFAERMKAYAVDIDYEKERAANSLSIAQTQLEADKTNIESFKAQWQALQIQLDAKLREYETRSRIYAYDIDIAKAQLSAGLDSDRLELEARNQDIEVYKADWQGLVAKADVWGKALSAETERYKADVQGKIAELDADGRKIDAEARKVDAEGRIAVANWEAEAARIRALGSSAEGLAIGYRAEVDAARLKTETDIRVYEANIEKEKAKLRVDELNQQGHIALMQTQAETAKLRIAAYTAKAEIESKRVDASAQAVQVNIAKFQADVERYKADAQGASAEVSAKAQIAQAKSSVAEANARIEQARVAAVAQNIDVAIRQAELDQRGMIEEAKIAVQQALTNAEIQSSGLQALGQMYAQLVAGAYSAANVSAQISSSYSANESDSWGVSYNYSGEMGGETE